MAMKFREVIVDHRKQVHVPKGWKVVHSTTIDPKGKEKYPKFAILMEYEDEEPPKNSRIGYRL